MLREYFSACEEIFLDKCPYLRKISLILCRNGIETMSELCRIYEQTPEKLLTFRSIGVQSLCLIGEVCRQYQKNVKQEEKR